MAMHDPAHDKFTEDKYRTVLSSRAAVAMNAEDIS
jgi:peptide subunit release factor RF-3